MSQNCELCYSIVRITTAVYAVRYTMSLDIKVFQTMQFITYSGEHTHPSGQDQLQNLTKCTLYQRLSRQS